MAERQGMTLSEYLRGSSSEGLTAHIIESKGKPPSKNLELVALVNSAKYQFCLIFPSIFNRFPLDSLIYRLIIKQKFILYNLEERDMGQSQRVNTIFKDAENLYREAIEELGRMKLRDAAEKAWGATVRATNALILARTGEEPERTPGTTDKLHKLAVIDEEIDRRLIGRYHTRADFLHGHCFYLGFCEPAQDVERRIKETVEYIEDARALANNTTKTA
jgi:hypothetical protein